MNDSQAEPGSLEGQWCSLSCGHCVRFMNSEGFCKVEVTVATCKMLSSTYLSMKNALLPKATIRHPWKMHSQVCLAADLLVLATRSSGRFAAQVHQM